MSRRISPRAARAKGLNFEREIARKFQRIFIGARRHMENQMADAKTGVDIQGCDPFKIQCKKTAKYVSIPTIEEIQCSRILGEIPLLVAAGDGREPMAVLPLDSLLWILKKIDWEE